MGTTMPAALDAVYDLLTGELRPTDAAAAATTAALVTRLAGVQVSFGHPGADQQDESVWVGGAETDDEVPGALGQGRQDERYRIGVNVEVQLAGATVQEAKTRAFALAGIVRDIVSANSTLGGIEGLRTALPAGQTYTPFFTDEGQGVDIEVFIACVARITTR